MAHGTGESSEGEQPWVPRDSLRLAARTGLMGGVAGLFIASIHNAMSKKNVGAFGVFTRGAPVIGLMTVGPAIASFTHHSIMNILEREDSRAIAAGGFLNGMIFGMPFKRMPVVLGMGALHSAILTTLHFTGNRIDSFKKEDDEFERKEIIRRTTRVPVEQTIAEIGEGRGIKPPGYEERRRERLKEKYGYEINPVKATIDGSS
ncbi:Tim17/Tim22/Tim23 family protein [Stachybotrys elegans]|uniref:Tim17/Tim22/Tim23 family protein n=1 Tax=Stachybotrys elegans TaxID=80388 RepID=A0A8K0WUC5_9HYPO|nr:Tim17/Tim22/Tim23 family protein [Stachybotrys elegans]